MQRQSEYRFWLESSARFRVLYGSPEFVADHLQPERITFGPAAPNPVAAETVIPFSLPGENETYQVQISVFDLQGHQVASLAEGTFRAGVHTISWNGTGAYGNRVASGVYICRMTVNGGVQILNDKIIVQ